MKSLKGRRVSLVFGLFICKLFCLLRVPLSLPFKLKSVCANSRGVPLLKHSAAFCRRVESVRDPSFSYIVEKQRVEKISRHYNN